MLLRPAIPQDALAVARVHVRSWQVAYRTLLPSAYLDQLRPEDRASKYDFANSDPSKPYTIVAAEEESILGFATTMQSQGAELGSNGELLALYVDPDLWNRGIGVALIAEARARLLDLGLRQASLWLLKGNERAIASTAQTGGLPTTHFEPIPSGTSKSTKFATGENFPKSQVPERSPHLAAAHRVPNYSDRNALIGSTAAARRAGSKHAAAPTVVSTQIVAPTIAGL